MPRDRRENPADSREGKLSPAERDIKLEPSRFSLAQAKIYIISSIT
jgi:hypothetical protein